MNHFKNLFDFLGKSFCFHKWKYIETDERHSTFLGKPVVYDVCSLRGCPKCGVVQEHHSGMSETYWAAIDDQQMKILKEKNMW